MRQYVCRRYAWLLQTAVGRLGLVVPVYVFSHLVARGRVLLVFPLVVAVLKQLLQELLLKCHSKFINAYMKVSGSLCMCLLLIIICVDPESLRLGQELGSRKRLFLLLLLLEL